MTSETAESEHMLPAMSQAEVNKNSIKPTTVQNCGLEN